MRRRYVGCVTSAQVTGGCRGGAGSGGSVENCFRTIHAEINAIAQAARQGTAIREADIYVTHTPCVHCFKTIVNTGIRRVFYEKPYKVETIAELRERAGVELVQVTVPARD